MFNKHERQQIIPVFSSTLVKALMEICTKIYNGVIKLPPWVIAHTHIHNRVRKLFYHFALIHSVLQAREELIRHTVIFDYIAFTLKHAQSVNIPDSTISTYQSASEKKFTRKIIKREEKSSATLRPDVLDLIVNQVLLNEEDVDLDVFFDDEFMRNALL